MKLGLTGLAAAGKTTLFNALTRGGAINSANSFSAVKPNTGKVNIPDERLERLSEIFNPKKTTPAFVEFVDIPGFVSRSGSSDKAGNKFLVHLREVDALVHTVRCFGDGQSAQTDNNVDPIKDIENLNLEIIISDLEIVEKRILAIEKKKRSVIPAEKIEKEILDKIKTALDKGIPARNVILTENEMKLVKSFSLLTLKPVIYCINISENNLGKVDEEPEFTLELKEYAGKEDAPVISICAKIEEEISQLEPADKEVFMNDMNISESGLAKLIKASYGLLGYINFFTVGADEVRAWTIKKGEKAPKAASKIHSDIERGFIRAETISFLAFMDSGGSFLKAKEKGLLRSEGKEYIVNDGDIIDFRFNV